MSRDYKCDKCAITDEGDKIKSLSAFYQRPYSTFKVRHLCQDCALLFDNYFVDFFQNKIKIKKDA